MGGKVEQASHALLFEILAALEFLIGIWIAMLKNLPFLTQAASNKLSRQRLKVKKN